MRKTGFHFFARRFIASRSPENSLFYASIMAAASRRKRRDFMVEAKGLRVWRGQAGGEAA
jgi:hypothetical protein